MPNRASLEIIIPVRNGGEPLVRTLRALQASEDQDFRVLISNNHSTDGAPWESALEAFRPGQVVLLRPPEPLGRIEHWTWVSQQSEADYCKLLMVGDRFPPDFIGKIRPALNGQPDLIYTPYLSLVYGLSLAELQQRLVLDDKVIPLSKDEYFKRSAVEFNLIGPMSTVVFRTRALKDALPFEPQFPWIADWRLYSRIMATGSAVYYTGTYCIQDRTIARVSSSLRGVATGAFEERAYQRELAGLPPRSRLGQWIDSLPGIGLFVFWSIVPRAVRKTLRNLLTSTGAKLV